MMLRKTDQMNRFTKTSGWNYTQAIPIRRFSEQTVGVVGLGRIGRNFAEKAAALGFRVIGYDPMVKQGEMIGKAEAVSFQELLKLSDAVSLHCPADGNQALFDMVCGSDFPHRCLCGIYPKDDKSLPGDACGGRHGYSERTGRGGSGSRSKVYGKSGL